MNSLNRDASSNSVGIDNALDNMIGRRSEQQDSARSIGVTIDGRPALLMIVADGMGGAVGGELAGKVAAAAFEARFMADDASGIEARLAAGLDAANAAIAAEIQRDRNLEGMGCTLVGVVTDGRDATWISVGDSLLLVAKGGGLERLNEDHSLAAVLDRAAERGEISRQEAETSPQRSMLRSALTGGPIAMIDRGSVTLKAGSRVLVATDGILTLPYAAIAKLAAEATAAAPLAAKILSAVQSDMPSDQDNLTLAVAMSSGGPGRARPPVPLGAKLAIALGGLVFVGAIVALVLLNRPTDPPAPKPKPDAAAGQTVQPSNPTTSSDTPQPPAPGKDQPIRMPSDNPAPDAMHKTPEKPAGKDADHKAPSPANPADKPPKTADKPSDKNSSVSPQPPLTLDGLVDQARGKSGGAAAPKADAKAPPPKHIGPEPD